MRVYAGIAADTRRAHYLTETIPTGPDAEHKAEQARLRLIQTVDQRHGLRQTATLDELITRHIAMMPLASSTKDNYCGYHRKHIHALIGQHPIGRVTGEMLDEFYAELARCRDHCPQPATASTHRRKHQCRPLSAGSIRKIHFLISAAYRSAIRWEWTTSNPAQQATPPSKPRPCPRPPTPDNVARILTEAWQQIDPFLAVAIWIAITTGARRGELCALRWSDFDVTNRVIHIRGNISHTSDGLVEKDTKLHEERRVIVDHDTAYLLAAYHDLRRQRALADGTPLPADAYILSPATDGTICLAPASLGQRFCRLVRSLSIATTLHKLRHYNATELILAGVDLRTVASRLGHRDAGTTLTTYTAWIEEANQRASTQLHGRLPLRLFTRPDTAVAARPSRGRAWEIATDLRDAITHQRHRPGQQLPPVKTLAVFFGVAPSTMHRAITQLAQWNLVTTAPGRRTTVVPNPPTAVSRTRGALPPLTSQHHYEDPPQRRRQRLPRPGRSVRRPRVAGRMTIHGGDRIP